MRCASARRALRVPARFGVGTVAVRRRGRGHSARVRRPVIVTGARKQARDSWHPCRLPCCALGLRWLSCRRRSSDSAWTLGELAALTPAALADRFGTLGLLAHELASGGDSALRPRPASEFCASRWSCRRRPGIQLERGLGLLIDRLLARRERRGRTLRAVVLSAVLVEAGGPGANRWCFGKRWRSGTDSARAGPRLQSMPARRSSYDWRSSASGRRRVISGDFSRIRGGRSARLREAIRQTRAAAGAEAAMRILEVDPGSRFPERRAVLTPFEGEV